MAILKKIFLALTLVILIPVVYFTFGERQKVPQMTWGVSFSAPYAKSLGVDWKVAYLSILDELEVSNLRLSSYWNEIETQPGIYDFSDLDFMMKNAESRGVKVILTLGLRQPRWPECHQPSWAEKLSEKERQSKVLALVRGVVKRYKNSPAVIGWQVENEFYVKWFGNCPVGEKPVLEGEIAQVRALDSRPIILTDSGELSWWFKAAASADVFGTTMYRRVYGPWGQAAWPYPPVYYSRLGKLVQFFSGFKHIIIAELQAEPWGQAGLVNDSTEVNFKTLSPWQFKANLEYAQNSGIDEAYLWGAEWWYYMKVNRGVGEYWEIAKSLWQ
ncbi:MAG: beta-galactosidase [Patescibacteria group bacterium]|nr:beta-galactosidase [Patescibacteria group bacterium]